MPHRAGPGTDPCRSHHRPAAVIGWTLNTILLLLGTTGCLGTNSTSPSTPPSTRSAKDTFTAELQRLLTDHERLQERWAAALTTVPIAQLYEATTGLADEQQQLSDRAGQMDSRIGGEVYRDGSGCDGPNYDYCNLVRQLQTDLHSEWFDLEELRAAVRRGRPAEARSKLQRLRQGACASAVHTITDLFDAPGPTPESPSSLNRTFPNYKMRLYAIATATCERKRIQLKDTAGVLAWAKTHRIAAATWPPAHLGGASVEAEWREYEAAIDRSAPLVRKVVTEIRQEVAELRDGWSEPRWFIELAGPDELAAMESGFEDRTWIGRLLTADRELRRMGPPGDPTIRAAWHTYQDTIDTLVQDVGEAVAGLRAGQSIPANFERALRDTRADLDRAVAAFQVAPSG